MKFSRFVFLLAVIPLLTACGSRKESQDTASVKSQINEAAVSDAEETEQIKETKQEVPSSSGELFAMDTYMTVTCYGEKCEEALQASLDEIQRLDHLLSVGDEDSEISRLNTQGSGTISEDTSVMVKEALKLYETTGGAFDITVYPLMELWGFTTGTFAVPDSAKLQEMLARTGSDLLDYDEDTAVLTLADGQGVDLGGIAKGYTSDRLMEIFAQYDLVSGVVSLGGNVQCYGTKPDGTFWRCGIKNPLDPDNSSNYLGVLSVDGEAVITSGAYERYFLDEGTGKTYHHILDPKTGYPADNGLISVTIVSESGMLADGLSTACYVMGLEDAVNYWQDQGENFDMILMTEEEEVYITEPLADCFTSDFTTHIISKE